MKLGVPTQIRLQLYELLHGGGGGGGGGGGRGRSQAALRHGLG